jgi:hypothetical protein
MECPKCKTENEEMRRFCRQCGAALVSICNRCENVNDFEDKFCGNCGAVLTAPLSQEHLFSSKALGDSKLPRQYGPNEIDELLSLRATVRQEQAAAEKLTQEDLDSLFK